MSSLLLLTLLSTMRADTKNYLQWIRMLESLYAVLEGSKDGIPSSGDNERDRVCGRFILTRDMLTSSRRRDSLDKLVSLALSWLSSALLPRFLSPSSVMSYRGGTDPLLLVLHASSRLFLARESPLRKAWPTRLLPLRIM